MALIEDPDLAGVLLRSSNDDLSLLIDVITDKGKGRISLSSSVCRRLNNAKDGNQVNEEMRALVAEELLRFGGNSFMNLFRGGVGVPYRELVTDVASHVRASVPQEARCEEIELAIVQKVLLQSMDNMSEAERSSFFESHGASYVYGSGPASLAALIATLFASRHGAFNVAASVAHATMYAMLGRGLAMAGSATATRGLGLLIGPVGWALTAIWTAFDLASPAYRVTVPCVLQIAYMRQKSYSLQLTHG